MGLQSSVHALVTVGNVQEVVILLVLLQQKYYIHYGYIIFTIILLYSLRLKMNVASKWASKHLWG